MNKKTKSCKILTFLLLPLLFACENAPTPLSGEKISIFNSEITDENIEKRIVLEKPYINKQWSSTSGNNENNVGHLAGKKQFKKLFSKSIGTVDDTNQILYRPVANKTTIFTIDGKLKITATNINTGKTIWEMERIKNNDLIKFGALALDDNYLYAITNSAQLLKLNAKTGEIAYSKYFNTPLKSGLQICENKLFFINDSNELYIIDKQTGNKLYTHKSMEEASSFIKGSTPLCMDDKLVATFSNGEIHMLMSDTTTPIWLDSVYKISTSNLNNISDIVANPIATKGLVIVKGYNDITKALTLRDGKQIWENSNGGITTPVISNETMFDINNNRVVSATDTKTGKQIWETRLNTYDMIFDPLLINNQLLIPVANGDIIKINPYTGRIIETINLTSKIDVSPIAVEDKLIILSNATLRVFN